MMENQIKIFLVPINTLSINTALWVFRKSFDNYFRKASQIPRMQMEQWVESFQNPQIRQNWEEQKQRKFPQAFIYGMLYYYQCRTLIEREHQRESSEGKFTPDSRTDFSQQKGLVDRITRYVDNLPIFDGVEFCGKLIGAWMLSCPEVIICSENNLEAVGKWQTGKETADWEVPEPWVRQIASGDPRDLTTDPEMKLLFTLDFLLHFAFSDYDTGNVV